MLNVLTIFFAVTTITVLAYPLIKLLPSWRERAAYRKMAFHRDAIDTIALQLERTPQDSDDRTRLLALQQQHTITLAALAPDGLPPKVDAAA